MSELLEHIRSCKDMPSKEFKHSVLEMAKVGADIDFSPRKKDPMTALQGKPYRDRVFGVIYYGWSPHKRKNQSRARVKFDEYVLSRHDFKDVLVAFSDYTRSGNRHKDKDAKDCIYVCNLPSWFEEWENHIESDGSLFEFDSLLEDLESKLEDQGRRPF